MVSQTVLAKLATPPYLTYQENHSQRFILLRGHFIFVTAIYVYFLFSYLLFRYSIAFITMFQNTRVLE